MSDAPTPDPASPQIVRLDEGGVNARILAREAKADYRRVEAASVKMPARLCSAEGKRLFVRLFATLQLNAHFISVIARTRMDHDDIARIEAALRDRIDVAAETLNRAIDGAEALFNAHGITAAATYDAQPLEMEVGVLSSSGRRYLEVITKLDQLMPLLQTLEIHEVITTQEIDRQRAQLKRLVRDIAHTARNLASGLRRRMHLPAPPPRPVLALPAPGASEVTVVIDSMTAEDQAVPAASALPAVPEVKPDDVEGTPVVDEAAHRPVAEEISESGAHADPSDQAAGQGVQEQQAEPGAASATAEFPAAPTDLTDAADAMDPAEAAEAAEANVMALPKPARRTSRKRQAS